MDSINRPNKITLEEFPEIPSAGCPKKKFSKEFSVSVSNLKCFVVRIDHCSILQHQSNAMLPMYAY